MKNPVATVARSAACPEADVFSEGRREVSERRTMAAAILGATARSWIPVALWGPAPSR